LIQIAQDGLYSTPEGSQTDTVIHESCAAESLALLKNLASRDALPIDSVNMLATSLCRFLSASETSIANIELIDSSTLEEEVVMQRTFVASNSAELLWILLSTESTCCETCDALLNLIDSKLTSDEYNPDSALDESGAISAVRALSAALWGKIYIYVNNNACSTVTNYDTL
jgi:hypothetical protein